VSGGVVPLGQIALADAVIALNKLNGMEPPGTSGHFTLTADKLYNFIADDKEQMFAWISRMQAARNGAALCATTLMGPAGGGQMGGERSQSPQPAASTTSHPTSPAPPPTPTLLLSPSSAPCPTSTSTSTPTQAAARSVAMVVIGPDLATAPKSSNMPTLGLKPQKTSNAKYHHTEDDEDDAGSTSVTNAASTSSSNSSTNNNNAGGGIGSKWFRSRNRTSDGGVNHTSDGDARASHEIARLKLELTQAHDALRASQEREAMLEDLSKGLRMVRVFRQTFTPEDAIGSHTCSLQLLA
jgi:hypothetical protein